MEFSANNNNDKLDKIEPQIEKDVVENQTERRDTHESFESSKNQFEDAQNTRYSQTDERYRSHNPILDFVKNIGETAEYLWEHYLDWVIHVSWGKMFLACLLILIAGSCLFLHTIANWFVFGSLLLKCFIGKEDKKQSSSMSEDTKPEEN